MSNTIGILASSVFAEQDALLRCVESVAEGETITTGEALEAERVLDTFVRQLPTGLLREDLFRFLSDLRKQVDHQDARTSPLVLDKLRQIARALREVSKDDYAHAAERAATIMTRGGVHFAGRAEVMGRLSYVMLSRRNPPGSETAHDPETIQALKALSTAMGRASENGDLSAVSWLWNFFPDVARAIEEAKQVPNSARTLGLLLEKNSDFFPSRFMTALVETAKAQTAVLLGLAAFIIHRPETVQTQHLSDLIKLAKTNSRMALAVGFLASKRPAIFIAENIPALLENVGKQKVGTFQMWTLSALKHKRAVLWLMGKNENFASLGAAWAIYELAQSRTEIFEKRGMLAIHTLSHYNAIIYRAVNILLRNNPQLARP